MTSSVKFQNDRSNAKKRLANFESRFPTIAFRICGDKKAADFKGYYVAADLTEETADQSNVLASQGIFVERAEGAPALAREAAAKAKTSAKKSAPAKPPKAHKPAAKAGTKATTPIGKPSAPTPTARAGTKQAIMIDMMRKPKGATAAEISEETGWQLHTIRGAIAGALKKKLGINVVANKVDGRGTVYTIPN